MTTQNTWTPEQLKRFKETHDAEPCQTAKDAIKRLAPEAFEETIPSFTKGSVWLSGTSGKIPYLLASNGYNSKEELIAVNLSDGWSTGPKPLNWFPGDNRMMINGIITLSIKDGKLARCKVEEAYETP